MHIAVVGPAYPLRGGIAHFNSVMISHLQKRHTIEAITFKRQYPAFLFPGKSQEETGGSTDTLPASLPRAKQLIDSINPFNWRAVGKTIAAMNADLLIFQYSMPFFGPCFGVIARIVTKRSKAKVLFVCHNIIPHEQRPGDIAFTKYAFKPGDCFIVQSSEVEKDLKTLVANPVYRKSPHPVYDMFGEAIDKSAAKAKLSIQSPRVVLFFGFVRKYKGLGVLIDAINRLRTTNPKLAVGTLLLVVGEFYDDEQRYRAQVRELGLESNVRFVSDYVPNGEVVNYFSAADVVVLPYVSATQSGIAQIAYNFGKPVIATSVGGLGEVVVNERTGYVVPPSDPSALANAIEKFYRENKETEFSTNAAQEKKRYSWDAFIGAIEDVVQSTQRAA